MPMHDWSRVTPGVWHNFHYRWIAAIIDRLNAGLLPKGMIAMAEQVVGGPEPDAVMLQPAEPDLPEGADLSNVATHTEAPPQPKTQFVISVEAERYAAKKNRVVVRHALGRVVAVIEVVSPGNKDSRHQISDNTFMLPGDRLLTLVAYQAAPVTTAFVEPIAVGQQLPDMPLFLRNNFYINVPLEATYMDSWAVLPQLLRDLVL